MTRLINMWSGPRNVSTAMMYSWRERSDTSVWDEPMYGHYLVVTGVDHPGREDILEHVLTDAAEILKLYDLWQQTGNPQARQQLTSLGISLDGGQTAH